MTSTKEKLLSASGCVLLTLSLLSLLLLFLLRAREAADAVLSALDVSLRSVIPSVFPSMVISSTLISLGGGELMGKTLGRPLARLLGSSRAAASAVILGALCGFPVGALTASRLYEENELTSSEFELIIGASSVPSPAFVINAVGEKLLGSFKLGIFLYASTVLISLLLLSAWSRSGRLPVSDGKKSLGAKSRAKPIASIVNAVSSSALASLRITAFIVFFSTLSTTVTELFIPKNAPGFIFPLVCGLLEFSGGCAAAAELSPTLSLPLCALFLGFSGVGAHFQIMSSCPPDTSFKKFFVFTSLRGVLSALTAFAVSSSLFGI